VYYLTMDAKRSVAHVPSRHSLWTIDSGEELDTVEVSDEVDTGVFTSSVAGDDELASDAGDDQLLQPRTEWHARSLRRQHAVSMIDTSPLPSFDADTAHLSADLQHSADTSQVNHPVENTYRRSRRRWS